jgi:nucleotide-binding universal stress UspA family protein
MYKTILIPVENSAGDRTILRHVRYLARLTGARLILLHVADGWAARNFEQLDLQESEEMKADRLYLDGLAEELKGEGFEVASVLAMGDPATEIIRVSQEKKADLIAMTTHGHRLIGDLIHGTTAHKVRHEAGVPVLFLKAQK